MNKIIYNPKDEKAVLQFAELIAKAYEDGKEAGKKEALSQYGLKFPDCEEKRELTSKKLVEEVGLLVMYWVHRFEKVNIGSLYSAQDILKLYDSREK